MSAVYTERTEPAGWRQAKIWKVLLTHLSKFSVEFNGPTVAVSAKGREHVFSSDLDSALAYAHKHWAAKGGVSGVAHPRAKLDPEKVAMIRARCGAGESQMVVARELGVSNRTISDVVCGRTWRRA